MPYPVRSLRFWSDRPAAVHRPRIRQPHVFGTGKPLLNLKEGIGFLGLGDRNVAELGLHHSIDHS
jgi:hypothetical protein